MDLPGAGLIMAAVICYILALEAGGITKPWKSATVIGLLVGFFLILIVFAVAEYLQDDRALLVPRILKDRTTLICAAFTAL